MIVFLAIVDPRMSQHFFSSRASEVEWFCETGQRGNYLRSQTPDASSRIKREGSWPFSMCSGIRANLPSSLFHLGKRWSDALCQWSGCTSKKRLRRSNAAMHFNRSSLRDAQVGAARKFNTSDLEACCKQCRLGHANSVGCLWVFT